MVPKANAWRIEKERRLKMNTISEFKKDAIISAYKSGLGIRSVAELVGCSAITVRTYLKTLGIEIRTISIGMSTWHKLKRHPEIDGSIPAPANPIPAIEESVFVQRVKKLCGEYACTSIPCGSCRNIFNDHCRYSSYITDRDLTNYELSVKIGE